MGWTTLAIVKKHLQLLPNAPSHIDNEEIKCTGTDPTYLANAGVTNVKVKTINQFAPVVNSSLSLSGTGYRALSYSEIVPGSFVLAADNLLSTIFLEGVDYIVSYPEGYLRRCSGGAISDPQTVYPFYLRFTTLALTTDYLLDTGVGSITRVAGGAIEDGEPLYVSYDVTGGSIDDNLISQCITEAEDWILNQLSSDYSGSSADQGLKTGATYLTLAAISRDMATKTLIFQPTDLADSAATSWLKIADAYLRAGLLVLSRFLKPVSLRNPNLPEHS